MVAAQLFPGSRRQFWFNSAMKGVVTSSSGSARIVVLLGTNYSGSHLLSHLLSAHPSCFGVGELHRYQQLLDDGASAPVVSEYTAQPVYAGLDQQSVPDWHTTLTQRVERDLAIPAPVIIDNSKKVRWVRRIAENLSNQITLVHLIRDPRALVLRWLNTYDTPRRLRTQRLRVAKRVPSRAVQILTGDWPRVFVYKWLRENRQISDFVSSSGLSAHHVTYHDMVFDTESMLQGLMPKLGLDYSPQQLRFGESTHLGTTKTAHAETVQRSEIRPDIKWQTELDASVAQKIAENPDVLAYLASLGLVCGPAGLRAG